MKSELSVQKVSSLLSMPANNTYNALHEFYNQLLANCDYPFIAKILYLQLVTRQNILLYSSRRAEVKQAWNGLAKQMKDNQASVFVIDPESKMDELLNIKGERRVLLFDLGKIGTQGVNFLLNNSFNGIAIFAVEDESRPLRSQLSDIFPLVFRDQQIQQEYHSTFPPSSSSFDRQKFQACIAANYNLSVQGKQQDSFFKSYVSLFKQRAYQYGVQLPLSRWKKMGLILKLIGTSRNAGMFKHLGPTDCLMAPECLGRTPQQIQNLWNANQQTLVDLIGNYGVQHWIKQLSHHFWISASRRNYYISIAQKLSSRVSFFYPCSKYGDVVRLLVDQKSFHYRVIGHDKKLLSDKYLPIDAHRTYRLSLQFRCVDNVLMHFGIACYNKDKQLISPVQVCRGEDTAVRIQSIQNNQLIIVEEDKQKLTNWKQSASFAYQRCIALYASGNTDVLLSQKQILLPETEHYSTDDNKAIYSSITHHSIILTDIGLKQLKKHEQQLILSQSKLMNHYQGGTYCLGGSFKGAQPVWKQVKMQFKGMSRQNNGCSFLMGTKWARIVLLVNYNSGYPQFMLQKKQTYVDLRTIEWLGM